MSFMRLERTCTVRWVDPLMEEWETLSQNAYLTFGETDKQTKEELSLYMQRVENVS